MGTPLRKDHRAVANFFYHWAIADFFSSLGFRFREIEDQERDTIFLKKKCQYRSRFWWGFLDIFRRQFSIFFFFFYGGWTLLRDRLVILRKCSWSFWRKRFRMFWDIGNVFSKAFGLRHNFVRNWRVATLREMIFFFRLPCIQLDHWSLI